MATLRRILSYEIFTVYIRTCRRSGSPSLQCMYMQTGGTYDCTYDCTAYSHSFVDTRLHTFLNLSSYAVYLFGLASLSCSIRWPFICFVLIAFNAAL